MLKGLWLLAGVIEITESDRFHVNKHGAAWRLTLRRRFSKHLFRISAAAAGT
jgi:hypothetical protein